MLVVMALYSFILNWRIVALPYCVGFCHTSAWISHRYCVCPLPLEPLAHLPRCSAPLGDHGAPGLSSLHRAVTPHWPSVCIWWCVRLSAALSIVPPFPSPAVPTSLFSVSASPLLPCRWVQQYHLSGLGLLCIPLYALRAQSCLTLCNPMDCSPPGSPVHGLLQARILDWVGLPFSRVLSRLRDRTCISYISCVSKHALYC